jgi:hypothetical protein
MVRTAIDLVVDVLKFVVLSLRSHARPTAENLFLRKQLAVCRAREVNRGAPPDATRFAPVVPRQVVSIG